MKFTVAARLKLGITMTKMFRGLLEPFDIATLSGGTQSERLRLLQIGSKITTASQPRTIYIAAGGGKMLRGHILARGGGGLGGFRSIL